MSGFTITAHGAKIANSFEKSYASGKEKSTCEFLRKCLILSAPELGLEPRTL
jgi:hypothetical protein